MIWQLRQIDKTEDRTVQTHHTRHPGKMVSPRPSPTRLPENLSASLSDRFFCQRSGSKYFLQRRVRIIRDRRAVVEAEDGETEIEQPPHARLGRGRIIVQLSRDKL
jgi:hypothetical protein